MFYTRVIINPRHPALRDDQQNAYLQHRRIESLFPDHKRSDASALFRWEQQTIFIQSTIEPRFDLLPKNYTHDVQTKMLNLDQLLQPNQWLEFRLLADTSGIEAETRRRKPRNAEQLPDWLTNRLEGAAKLDDFMAIQHGPHIAVQRLEQRWKVKPTSFTGYLNIIDPKQLADVIVTGFGRSRAYGCGLMQIAPLKEKV